MPDGASVEVSVRETVADDSPRGEHYHDDRTVLAHVFDGLSLRAVLYDRREVRRYGEDTQLTVSLTAAGEHRCRAADRTECGRDD